MSNNCQASFVRGITDCIKITDLDRHVIGWYDVNIIPYKNKYSSMGL